MTKKIDTTQFVKKAKEIHGDKYDYSEINYVKASGKVIIICQKHGVFLQQANLHLTGSGCAKCGHATSALLQRTNKEEFIKKATKKHGNKYDYSKVEYINCKEKVIIICKEHGEFLQSPDNHLYGGCTICAFKSISDSKRKPMNEFIESAIKIHGDMYDYSKVVYIRSIEKIIIICKEHGEFLQEANSHLAGHKCKKCAFKSISDNLRSNNESFIIKANKVHENKYDYSKVNYSENGRIPVIIICKEHGEFLQSPNKHLYGNGCKKCCHKKYSKSSILYLNFISKLRNIKIQHGENASEYTITGTKFKADGYCEETNTIYEFHGTHYHGDPRLCNPTDYSYFGKKFGELYKKTLEREQQIRDLGYNLIVIWEHDWNKINKSIKTIQRIFKSINQII